MTPHCAGGVSIRTTLATAVNEDCNGKSWSVSYLDSPGHPQCFDGVLVAMRAADGVVLVVDVVEGLLQPSIRILEQVPRLMRGPPLPPAHPPTHPHPTPHTHYLSLSFSLSLSRSLSLSLSLAYCSLVALRLVALTARCGDAVCPQPDTRGVGAE